MRRLRSWGMVSVVLVFFATVARADVVLTATSDISIREDGGFDTASGWLTEVLGFYLKQSLGREQLRGAGEPVECVIRSQVARWQALPDEAIGDLRDIDAFQIEIESKPSPRVIISGTTPVGAGYGVMAFLEDHVGVHWAFPGELGLCLPANQAIRLREGIYSERPFVVARAFSGLVLRTREPLREKPRGSSGVVLEQRGFFQADDYFKTLRMGGSTVTHAMARIFPVRRCEVECPEIFPKYVDGRTFIPQPKAVESRGGKNAYQAWHPCYSEPKSLEIAIAAGRDSFALGHQFYSLGINDGRRFQCQCPDCRNTGWPQSYYNFVTQVADELSSEFPIQKVGVLAYGDVGVPPAGLKLPANVLVNVAGQRKEMWEGKAPSLGSYEYIYGAGFITPNLPWEIIQENFRYYRRQNLQLYRAEMYPLWAFDAPKAYVIRKLLWDPDRDVHELLRQYCDRTFGAAGAAMYEYYVHAGSWRRDDVRTGTWTPMWDRVWPLRRSLQFKDISRDFHQPLFAALESAEREQLTDQQRRRVRMVEHFTRFSHVYFQIWQIKEAVFAGKLRPEMAAEIERLTVASTDIVNALKDHQEWFVGSSVGPESFGNREWPVASLRGQLSSAASTLAAQNHLDTAAKQWTGRSREQLTPLRRSEHSWYKPWQSQHMQPQERIPGGFQFRSADNETINDDTDTRYNGRLKFQWLHANGRNLQIGGRYLLRSDLTGFGGLLELRVQGTVRGESRERVILAQSVIEFNDRREQRHQFVVDLKNRANVDVSDELNLQWVLLWRPDRPDAEVYGTAQVAPLSD